MGGVWQRSTAAPLFRVTSWRNQFGPLESHSSQRIVVVSGSGFRVAMVMVDVSPDGAQRLIGDILRASKGEATASIIATFCTTTGRYKFSLSSRTWLGFLRRHFTVSQAGRYRKRGSIERLCVGCQRHGFRTQARVSESADGFFGRMPPEAVQCGRCRAGRALVG